MPAKNKRSRAARDWRKAAERTKRQGVAPHADVPVLELNEPSQARNAKRTKRQGAVAEADAPVLELNEPSQVRNAKRTKRQGPAAEADAMRGALALAFLCEAAPE